MTGRHVDTTRPADHIDYDHLARWERVLYDPTLTLVSRRKPGLPIGQNGTTWHLDPWSGNPDTDRAWLDVLGLDGPPWR